MSTLKVPKRMLRASPVAKQKGVVLIMALIMLVIITMLSTFSMRNGASTEIVSGNVRTTALASQAAEMALRYCEEATIQISAAAVTLASVPTIQSYSATPLWNVKTNAGVLTNWDTATSTSPPVFVVPLSVVNQNATTDITFKRAPECIVERVQVLSSTGVPTSTNTYIITARGFGPEVAAADASRSRPVGSEAWMQSTIELN